MGLNGESKLALLGDPLQGTPVYDPSVDMQPASSPQAQAMEAPFPPQSDQELQKIETALIDVMRYNTDQAIALNQWRKRRWMMYMQMEQGRPPLDDVNDPLIQLGYYQPILAKFRDIMKALLVNMLDPDPSEADFFELDAKPLWEGIDKLAEALTALLRDKFKNMSPELTGGFLAIFVRLIDDFLVYGNCTALVTHEMLSDPFEPDNQDGLIEGPTIRRISPLNVFNWRDDVSSFGETFTSIFDPVTPDQAHQMGFVNTDKLFANESAVPCRNLYMATQTSWWTGGQWSEEWKSPGTEQYERWIGIGRFPFYQLRKSMGEQEKDVVFEPDLHMVMQTLSTKYMFDPMKVTPDTWFNIEWVGNTIIKCKPYELALPMNKGPILHAGFYTRGDYLWADGLYDRCQWDERFYNDLQRAVLTLVKFTAKGVFAANKDMVDQVWYQMHGSQIKFTPGDVIELNTRPGDNRKFFEKVDVNEEAIPHIREQQKEQLSSIRMLTGIYESVEGNSTAGTATQDANNLQQGLAIIESVAKQIEDGLMKELVARCYVVMQQAAGEIGHTQSTMISQKEGMLQQVHLNPLDIISLNCIYIRMTGRNSPANKMNLIDKVMAITQLFIQTGIVDIKHNYVQLLKMAGLSGADQYAFQPDMQQIQAWATNLQMMTGSMPGDMSFLTWLPPAVQQQIGMMLNPQGPGGAGGAGQGPGGPPQAGVPQPTSQVPAAQSPQGAQPPGGTPPGQPRQGNAMPPPQMMQSSGNGSGPPMFGGGH